MVDMLKKGLNLADQEKRATIAEMLDNHPYFNKPEAVDPFDPKSKGSSKSSNYNQ